LTKIGTSTHWRLVVGAWFVVALGVFAVAAAASVLGMSAGAFVGAFGVLLAREVLGNDPSRRTRRVAKVGLALNVLALTIVAAIVIAIVIGIV
jgi:hypothetical protein